MTERDERRRQLEAMLRAPSERLTPPDGVWEQIGRRAKRRKFAKAALGVAAGVTIVAGAVPAVIAVRHTGGGDQSVSIGQDIGVIDGGRVATPRPSASTDASLAGFVPESATFVTQTDGYLWGSIAGSVRGVIARTFDGGHTWTRRPAPPIDDSYVADHGDGQIRFATDAVGFVFGAKYFMTRDGGTTWSELASPGYIDTLETRNDKIWALVRDCRSCRLVTLYSATIAHPTLRRVTDVGQMRGKTGTATTAGTDSLAVSDSRVVVIVGHSGVWLTPNGRTWTQGDDPCQDWRGHAVQSSLVAISGGRDVVAACGYRVMGNSEVKRTYTSTTGGHTWRRTKSHPPAAGWLQTLTSGTSTSAIVGTARGGAAITHDSGQTWTAVTAHGINLSFIGNINVTRYVALADADSETGAFAITADGGATWTVTSFPAAD